MRMVIARSLGLEKAASWHYLLAHTFPQEINARADQLSERTLRAAAWMVYAFSVMQFAAHFVCGEGARNYTLCHYMSCARFNFITGQPC
jgi:hypothetical protein